MEGVGDDLFSVLTFSVSKHFQSLCLAHLRTITIRCESYSGVMFFVQSQLNVLGGHVTKLEFLHHNLTQTEKRALKEKAAAKAPVTVCSKSA